MAAPLSGLDPATQSGRTHVHTGLSPGGQVLRLGMSVVHEILPPHRSTSGLVSRPFAPRDIFFAEIR